MILSGIVINQVYQAFYILNNFPLLHMFAFLLLYSTDIYLRNISLKFIKGLI